MQTYTLLVADYCTAVDATNTVLWPLYSRVPILFQQWLFHDRKMKIHDVSAQHIFPNELYMTYECIPELVLTDAAARHTTVKKIRTHQEMR